MLADQADHVFGVDTHRDSHSAAILAADTAVVQGQTTIAANDVDTGGCCARAWERSGPSCMGGRGNGQLRRGTDVSCTGRRAGTRGRPSPPTHAS